MENPFNTIKVLKELLALAQKQLDDKATQILPSVQDCKDLDAEYDERQKDEEILTELLLASLSGSHYEVAKVFYHVFKNVYICTSTRHRMWAEYCESDDSWHESPQVARDVRYLLSTTLYDIYDSASINYYKRALENSQKDQANCDACFDGYNLMDIAGCAGQARMRISRQCREMAEKLRKAGYQENLMKECAELFYAIPHKLSYT